MHISLQPVPGHLTINLRVEADTISINGTVHDVADLGDDLMIEYGEEAGVATCLMTQAHTVAVIPSTFQPAYIAPVIDVEAEAQAALQMLRSGWSVDRWQIKTVLGKDRWDAIKAFGASPDAPWGLQTVIADAVTIPRVSQTVDLLGYILGMTDDDVDGLFMQAMTLHA